MNDYTGQVLRSKLEDETRLLDTLKHLETQVERHMEIAPPWYGAEEATAWRDGMSHAITQIKRALGLPE